MLSGSASEPAPRESVAFHAHHIRSAGRDSSSPTAAAAAAAHPARTSERPVRSPENLPSSFTSLCVAHVDDVHDVR